MNVLKRVIEVGEEIVVDKEIMGAEFHSMVQRIFVCEGGFGMMPFTTGGKIHGHWKIDGQLDTLHASCISVEETIEWQKLDPDYQAVLANADQPESEGVG